jgi:hypothetical protein
VCPLKREFESLTISLDIAARNVSARLISHSYQLKTGEAGNMFLGPLLDDYVHNIPLCYFLSGLFMFQPFLIQKL